ncbi:MAG: DUF3817 domain-containing protein [Firmicutes bacterium]|uniref:Integral membrane protein n=1 Tax=Melghirimyces thermohalophilus TaxID=1236220 RepID=A0A1G6I8Q5_9BACL|nr:DUF3817 domain-containing protein [Melghirimyces thermohalophilus]MDA8351774.1 DUF3817 domain-containing protein [Bacillota bacterium]SDC02831.1 integral membrane protein [Melghirimyces thermohalophilus]
MNTPFGRFRVIGLVEGISYLVLLGVAMPLKYGLDWPMAVTVTGWIHGLLFVIYFAALVHVWFAEKWPLGRVFGAAVASVLPFGPFVFDVRMKRHQTGTSI